MLMVGRRIKTSVRTTAAGSLRGSTGRARAGLDAHEVGRRIKTSARTTSRIAA
jgi:hypothetical protein